MGNKTTRFLTVSLAFVSFFCVLIFAIQTYCSGLTGADAINELGIIYMSDISEQVAAHFDTIIELRLSQVSALTDSVPPDPDKNSSAARIALTYNARARGFEYLAYYTDDGAFQMIYGSKVMAEAPEIMHNSIKDGKENVSAGKDEAGRKIVLMGVPAKYAMGDGRVSAALVAGFPSTYLSDTLDVTLKNSMVQYSIIRTDGDFILHSTGVLNENYFERIAGAYETIDGKDAQQYAEELKTAMESGQDYSGKVAVGDEQLNLYCTQLPNSEWYLMLYMSYNVLDDTVRGMQKRWIWISMSGCLLMLGALLLVFVGYFHLTRNQLRALDEARRAADSARESAERASRAKSEFLSNMSHDIRTPMNGIMGMTAIAINNLDNKQQVRTCLKKISVSGRHLLGLINDILDMSKIENGRLTLNTEPLSICDVMQNIMVVIQPQVLEKDQQFSIYVYDILYEHVCADRVRLSQILLNILGNAVKFTPKGGVIQAFLYEEPSPKGNKFIRTRLHIKDNGIGISPEFIDKIYDAFSREDNARVEKTAGAGMGMTITKSIVDAMGGSIEVESRQGEGSDFCVTLDMEKTSAQEPELVLPNADVLLVDDDEIAAETETAAVRSIGLSVECVPDVVHAVKMAEERRSSGRDYQAVLLDWDLKDQNAADAVLELRRRFGSSLPILLLCDGDWEEKEAEAEKAGADGFIAKPLFRSSLYTSLRQFIEKDLQREQEEREEIDFAGRRILAAEDNELNREIADAMLSEFGIEIEWAENGRICVEKFMQSPPGWFDAVLMDLRMPVMTGFEAAVEIRSLAREDAAEIPIIAVSADAFDDDVQKCIDCGMNAHTAKPYNMQEIVSLLSGFFR